ncbi:MAG: D-glycerate dehydrogenase [Deltaproteobacteria bacterium]|nr:D-glycerate dehydrogenase [Deltaproteobacteria bacterium]
MRKPKVFITRLIPREGIDLLKETCEVEINPQDRPLHREELLAQVADKDGVIGMLSDRIDAEFFDAAKALRGYANFAVGFDNIDVAEATRRNMPVSNTPGVLTQATAELAWALLFAVARRIVETDRIMRSGAWPGLGPLQFIGADVSGKTLGIVGGGRIGTAMALMSKGFQMRVLYTNTSGKENQTLQAELRARLVSLDELLAESDFISIHTPLTPATRHLFKAETFARMKPAAILINTARGPIIKEDDLVAALGSRTIAGAGLDVYEFEPQMTAGLADLNNAVVVPHIGSATSSSRAGMSLLAARNLLAMLQGEKPESCLNPEIYA